MNMDFEEYRLQGYITQISTLCGSKRIPDLNMVLINKNMHRSGMEHSAQELGSGMKQRFFQILHQFDAIHIGRVKVDRGRLLELAAQDQHVLFGALMPSMTVPLASTERMVTLI